MPTYLRIRFIVNPRAGRGKRDIGNLIRESMGRSGPAFEVLWTRRRGQAEELAREAVGEGADLVVAAGGDGTVHEVACGLAGSEAALGILPCGSGNGLARALRIPLDLRRACRALTEARTRRIDAGEVAGRLFFATAGVGLDAQVADRFDRGRRRGMLAYVWMSAGCFLSHAPESIRLTLDDRAPFEACPTILTLANTEQYGGGARIAPGAVPDDGLLDICLMEDVSLARGLWHVRRLFDGTLARMPGVRMFRASRIRIERPGPGPLQLDGEPLLGEAVLDARVIPGALKVAVA
jgi:YegS/Rv2252/BmrU family lipid kinase